MATKTAFDRSIAGGDYCSGVVDQEAEGGLCAPRQENGYNAILALEARLAGKFHLFSECMLEIVAIPAIPSSSGTSLSCICLDHFPCGPVFFSGEV